MKVGELARRSGTTIRALRYYEELGLVVPRRLGNGYREYDPIAVRQVTQIRELTALGLTVEETRPFVESLAAGSDRTAEAMATFRSAISGLQSRIGRLTAQRDALEARLATVTVTGSVSASAPPALAPAALAGRPLPELTVFATDGRPVDFRALGPGRTILFVYPLTGRPTAPNALLEIPGARGTEPAQWFRDHHRELLGAGAARVYGLSAQSSSLQRELVHRLRLPYPLIPDPRLILAATLGLPTFAVAGGTGYERLTLVLSGDAVEHVFHPIPAPSTHAHEVLRWLNRARVESGPASFVKGT